MLEYIKYEYTFLEGQCKNKEQIKKLPKAILFDLFYYLAMSKKLRTTSRKLRTTSKKLRDNISNYSTLLWR